MGNSTDGMPSGWRQTRPGEAEGVYLEPAATADDLAAWLTAIWDERQRACQEAQEAIEAHSALSADGTLELRWMLQLRRDGVFQTGWTMPGPPTPAEDLARIATERAILKLHSPNQVADKPWCDTDQLTWPCRTVRLVAVAYAARPGYQDAWRPHVVRSLR